MSEKSDVSLDTIVALAKRRGFVFPTSTIYGGLANSYDYGPLGTELLRAIKNLWWREFISKRPDMVGLDSQIMLHPQTWVASGHVSAFNDPLVEDTISHKRFRADHLIEAWAEKNNTELQVAKQNIQLANITLKERKADQFPIVSLNSAYNYSKTNNKLVVNNFTPLFNRNNGFNYGVSISIPILNSFTVKRQIKEAKLDIAYQQMIYDYQKSKINTAISNAFKDYELQLKTLELEESNILLAKENVYIAVERLRLGISTSLELRETQKSLEDAYNRLIAARYNTKVAETELLRLRGDLVK